MSLAKGVLRLDLALRTAVKRALGHHSWNADDDQRTFAKSARVIFDIGANVGQTALRYRVVFPQAQVFSFEPVPETFQKLQRAVAGDPQVRAMQLAMSDRASSVPMYIQSHSVMNSLLPPQGNWDVTQRVIEVQTTTVDLFCEQNGIEKIDILKVDAEGAELSIFRGAAGMFSRRAIQCVFTEVYFDPIYAGMPLFADLDAELKRLGFLLHGLYSFAPGADGHLNFANALYYSEEPA